MTKKAKQKPAPVQKRQSQTDTRRALEAALARLRNGRPKVVEPNTKISISLVAREAGVHRTTVYNYHPGIVSEIQKLADRTAKDQLKQKRSQLKLANAELRELKATIEQLQRDKTNLARINHALTHRNQELQSQVAIKDKKINQLMRRLNMPSKAPDLQTED
jgi:AcrR family transcriptional regulator